MWINFYLLFVTLSLILFSSLSPTPFAPLPLSLAVKVETKVSGSLNCQTSKSLLNIWHLKACPPPLPPQPHLACMGTSLTEITISGRINEACFLLNLLPPTHGMAVHPGAGGHSTPGLSLLTLGRRRWARRGWRSPFTRQKSWTFWTRKRSHRKSHGTFSF